MVIRRVTITAVLAITVTFPDTSPAVDWQAHKRKANDGVVMSNAMLHGGHEVLKVNSEESVEAMLDERKNFEEWSQELKKMSPAQVGHLSNEALKILMTDNKHEDFPDAVLTPEFWNAIIDDMITVSFMSVESTTEQRRASLGMAERLIEVFKSLFNEDTVIQSQEAWRHTIEMGEKFSSVREKLYQGGLIDKWGRQAE